MKKILAMSLAVVLFSAPFGVVNAETTILTRDNLQTVAPQMSAMFGTMNSVLVKISGERAAENQTLSALASLLPALSVRIGQASVTQNQAEIDDIANTLGNISNQIRVIQNRRTQVSGALVQMTDVLKNIGNILASL